MTAIFFNYMAVFLVSLPQPTVLIYLGLSVVHLLTALCYLKHEGGLPLALCAAMTSALYFNLAMLHGVVH
jgi:hypothetical protein